MDLDPPIYYSKAEYIETVCGYVYVLKSYTDSSSRTPAIRFLAEPPLPDPRISFSEGKPLFPVGLSFVEICDAQILGMPSSFLWDGTA